MSLKVLIQKTKTVTLFFIAMAQQAPFLENATTEIPFYFNKFMVFGPMVYIYIFFFLILRFYILNLLSYFKIQQNKGRTSLRKHMQNHESGSQKVEQEEQNQTQGKRNYTINQQKTQVTEIKTSQLSCSGNQSQSSHTKTSEVKDSKLQIEPKAETSLQNISIESPLKKPILKSEAKFTEKTYNLRRKMSQKAQMHSKQGIQKDIGLQPKLGPQSNIKSSLKSSHRVKKINRPFYDQTFYITGMKQNYLLLLSDTNQVLEFPIGMFTTQGESPDGQKISQETSSNKNENYHLIKDIKIGQPIKIKLEFDFMRQQKDDKLFLSLQKNIHTQYQESYQQQQSPRVNKEISLRKNK